MKTLAQFKAELGVAELTFSKSVKTGRMFTTVGVTEIIVATNFDSKKPAYVFYNADKGFNVVCNSGLVEGITL